MGKKIFGIYLAKLDAPNSEAHARLELPASPLELHDAMDKVRLQENEEVYLEIDDYYGFEYLAPHLMELNASLNELNDLAGRLAVLDETEQEAFDGLLRLEIQRKVESNGSTVTMGAAHPTCIPCSMAAKKRCPPPREDCAFLLDPGEVHDGPPRRTHSTGDLIQRKNSGIVAEYRIYFNIEMGQAASVYTCYLPCRNRYFFFMDRSSIYPRLPRGSN